MAERVKITFSRVAAIAAFACAMSFAAMAALLVSVMTGEGGRSAVGFSYFWGGCLLAAAPPLPILLMLMATSRHAKPGIGLVLTGAPFLIAIGFSILYGRVLAEMGERMISDMNVQSDGAFSMGVAFIGVFVWLVVLGLAAAAVIASAGVARPLGPVPTFMALLTAVFAVVSIWTPFLAPVTLAGMAAWWAAVGAALWGLDALGDGGP